MRIEKEYVPWAKPFRFDREADFVALYSYTLIHTPLTFLYTPIDSGQQEYMRTVFGQGDDYNNAVIQTQLEMICTECVQVVDLGDGHILPNENHVITMLPIDDLVELSAALMGIRRWRQEGDEIEEEVQDLWRRLGTVI